MEIFKTMLVFSSVVLIILDVLWKCASPNALGAHFILYLKNAYKFDMHEYTERLWVNTDVSLCFVSTVGNLTVKL